MQFVVLAGGMGTRSQSKTPKILQKVGNNFLLQNLLKEIQNFEDETGEKTRVLFLLKNQAEKIIEQIEVFKADFDIEIEYLVEEKTLGTAGALKQALIYLEKEIVIVLGDLFFDFSFSKLVEFARLRKSYFVPVVHPNDHSFDSDTLVLDPISNKILEIDLKSHRTHNPISVTAMAGIYFLKNPQKVFSEEIKQPYDLLEFLTSNKINFDLNSFGYLTVEYIKDTGTPARLNKVNSDLKKNLPSLRSSRFKKPCIFLDKDDTLMQDDGLASEIRVGTASELRICNQEGFVVIVVSNQPHAAKGQVTLNDIALKNRLVDIYLQTQGAYLDVWYWCPHHPEVGFKDETRTLKVFCKCRKPNTGLVEFAQVDHGIDLEKSFLIGDSRVDYELSLNAKLNFVHTTEFKNCQIAEKHTCFNTTEACIRYARDKMRVNLNDNH